MTSSNRTWNPGQSNRSKVEKGASETGRQTTVTVLTFSDRRDNVYRAQLHTVARVTSMWQPSLPSIGPDSPASLGHAVHALAASVAFFNNGSPLYVLGLSGRRAPSVSRSGRWAIERQSIKGTDPGKLKKLWFLGALLEQQSPLGMRDDDIILFVRPP